MPNPDSDRWKEIAEQISQEQDSSALDELTQETNRALQELRKPERVRFPAGVSKRESA